MRINQEQKVYVIPCGDGYTCLGFDVCERKTRALAQEYLRSDLIGAEKGTEEAYNNYQKLIAVAKDNYEKTRCCSTSELSPQLIGLEGKRIEVVDCWGNTNRFYVGKSTGFIPCHLEMRRRDSSGGCAVMGTPFKKIKVL